MATRTFKISDDMAGFKATMKMAEISYLQARRYSIYTF